MPQVAFSPTRPYSAAQRGGLWSVPRMRQVWAVRGEAKPEGTDPPPSSYSKIEKSTRKLTQQAPQVVQADMARDLSLCFRR